MNKNGITLVEVIVMGLILTMISGVGYRLMTGTFTQFFKSQTKLTNLRAGSIVMERIKHDLRHALIPADDSERPTIISEPNRTVFRFAILNDGQRAMVNYTYENNQITREIEGVGSRVISTVNVSAFSVQETGDAINPMVEIVIAVDRDSELEGRSVSDRANQVELRAVLYPRFYLDSLSDEEIFWNLAQQRAGGTI